MKTSTAGAFLFLAVLFGACLYWIVFFSQQYIAVKQRSFLDTTDDEDYVLVHSIQRPARKRYGSLAHCTMQTCFDIHRCRNGFKVYVYPSYPSDKVSSAYNTILNVIRNSHYYTPDPTQACLLVPNLDTLDRDPRSRDYVRGIGRKIKALTHWNKGKNHLLFNMYSGKFPNYEANLFMDYGKAILARSSASDQTYREGFDVSFPLLGSQHTSLGKSPGSLSQADSFLSLLRKKYLLVFKGKRYMVGYGSETRNNLYKIDNDKDILFLTTCNHMGFSFEEDEQCEKDNKRYQLYDYVELMSNSTFCLIPRGRRLGSFRFLEAMRMGCIPVSLSNGYVLPFQEVIDWRKSALVIDERRLEQVPDYLRRLSQYKVLAMSLQTQMLWENYFSSIEKVVYTTLEIIRSRIEQSLGPFVWNRSPGGLYVDALYSRDLSDYPYYSLQPVTRTRLTGFTAVIVGTEKQSADIQSLISRLCSVKSLVKIIISSAGSKKFIVHPKHCNTPIEAQRGTSRVWPTPDGVDTDGILLLTSDSNLSPDEAEYGYSVWRSNTDRLVGLEAHSHYSLNNHTYLYYQPQHNYSMVTHGALFYHKYYGYLMDSILSQPLSSLAARRPTHTACRSLILNMLAADITRRAPIKVTSRWLAQPEREGAGNTQWLRMLTNYNSCFDEANTIMGYCPLQHSYTRADIINNNQTVL